MKKPRLRVLSMADAMKQLRSALTIVEALKLQLTAASAEIVEWIDKLSSEQNHRFAAERETANARKEHADLKKRLHDATVELARLNGYVERVREDDNVADPLVDVEDQFGKRKVSKRHPKVNRRINENYVCADTDGFDQYGRKVDAKHWTSY